MFVLVARILLFLFLVFVVFLVSCLMKLFPLFSAPLLLIVYIVVRIVRVLLFVFRFTDMCFGFCCWLMLRTQLEENGSRVMTATKIVISQ